MTIHAVKFDKYFSILNGGQSADCTMACRRVLSVLLSYLTNKRVHNIRRFHHTRLQLGHERPTRECPWLKLCI